MLYLLHGLSDDHSMWLRQTSIERYAADRHLAIVMPSVGRSWYTDLHAGGAYFTYVSEELPTMIERMLRVSDQREDRYAAGLSMGGYGAFKLAMARLDRYAAAASLSGALGFAGITMPPRDPQWERDMRAAFADPSKVRGTPEDIFHLAQRLAGDEGPPPRQRPRLFACCGTEDFLYDQNQQFRDHAASLNLQLTYEEESGYGHTWDYWDLKIQRVLEWLNL